MEERSEPQISSMNSEPLEQDLSHALSTSRACLIAARSLCLTSSEVENNTETEHIGLLSPFSLVFSYLQVKTIESKASL